MSEESILSLGNFFFIIFVIVAILYGLFNFVVSRRWNRHRAATVGKWEAEGLEFIRGPVGGQFGGLESMGINRVIRGIGFVAMTTKDLRVTRATPEGVWCVTYKQIKGVAIQPAFLGHKGKTPFIVVRFVKEGKPDKLGFLVKNFEEWAEELAEAAEVSLKDPREE
jgi:hypothetical protein